MKDKGKKNKEGEINDMVFRDFLDGTVYFLVAFLALIFIMAIIGFLYERKQLEREKRNREAVLGDMSNVSKVSTVTIQEDTISNPSEENASDVKSENAATQEDIPTVLDFNEIDMNQNQGVSPITDSAVQVEPDVSNPNPIPPIQ